MIKLPQYIYDAIIEHAWNDLPNEACGLITGNDNMALKRFALTNIDHSPDHFSFDPQEQFDVLRFARNNSQEIIANYHSHPSTPARPSEEDIRLAYDPNILYLIVSLAFDVPILKAFRIENGQVSEEKIEVMA